ncbi:splicing factor 3B subunit 2-like [Daktulosphaira vitifoliae]|uniref:splicing factor 3B subunit 2-like n=1 Tax=Daktulosphaira vitifoliae TaxID=58002 RepID=UPI0021A9E926|nr:splicing factor 3B subunit 2-like [Daktulosphaira vitifoliae]XP_050526171.1 splicing factor 3B subunit 2-like [Daktulosphaira vitifoliae]
MYESEIHTDEALVQPSEVVTLPPALEQALNYKDERAKEVEVDEKNFEGKPQLLSKHDDIQEQLLNKENEDDDNNEDVDDEQEKQSLKLSSKDRKVAKRRKKKYKKKKKQQLKNEKKDKEATSSSDKENKIQPLDIEVEYIQETLSVFNLVPMYRQYAKVFENFKIPEPEQKPLDQGNQESLMPNLDLKKVPKLLEQEDDDDDEHKMKNGESQSKDPDKLSRRQFKKVTRLSVAELKQLVSRPDVVEMHDVTARDPHLLIQLKAHRNTVPVPRHWCFKRKYLQGKRGIEKPPFDLPDFIKRTGIMEMRAAHQEKEDEKSLKNKMRERVRPKMGKIDIDYKKLHDAFFKLQTKPKLSLHGDLYYEGKEYETKLREKKPGDLSAELRTALGMPVGHNAQKVPPPWLIAMQRYGPPPSYPALKIPGLNAPIPEGCSFGYHAGGWGKPPVDERGRPLYGNVFGTPSDYDESNIAEEVIDKSMWGEPDSESDVEESEEEEDEEEVKEVEEVALDASGIATPVAEGLATPSGIMSGLPSGYETPEYIELRKRKIESEMETSEQQPLYHVLPEKKVDTVRGSMMASTHMYDIPSTVTNKPGEVEVSLDPSELELAGDVEAMAARYEQRMKDQRVGDDDGVESEKKKGQKRKSTQDTKTSKKYKDFKF